MEFSTGPERARTFAATIDVLMAAYQTEDFEAGQKLVLTNDGLGDDWRHATIVRPVNQLPNVTVMAGRPSDYSLTSLRLTDDGSYEVATTRHLSVNELGEVRTDKLYIEDPHAATERDMGRLYSLLGDLSGLPRATELGID